MYIKNKRTCNMNYFCKICPVTHFLYEQEIKCHSGGSHCHYDILSRVPSSPPCLREIHNLEARVKRGENARLSLHWRSSRGASRAEHLTYYHRGREGTRGKRAREREKISPALRPRQFVVHRPEEAPILSRFLPFVATPPPTHPPTPTFAFVHPFTQPSS